MAELRKETKPSLLCPGRIGRKNLAVHQPLEIDVLLNSSGLGVDSNTSCFENPSLELLEWPKHQQPLDRVVCDIRNIKRLSAGTTN